jgi:hypothetical protein
MRLENQRIFFVENELEVTTGMLERNSLAPLLALRTMHRNVGLDLQAL